MWQSGSDGNSIMRVGLSDLDQDTIESGAYHFLATPQIDTAEGTFVVVGDVHGVLTRAPA